MMEKNQIKKALIEAGADSVRRTFNGEWSTLRYVHRNHAACGKWLLFAQSDAEAHKRIKDDDFSNVK